MDPSYPILDQALANDGLENTSSKHKWEAMSRKKGSDSSSSYDGPIVRIAKYRASTAPRPQLPTRILPILPGPKLAQWAACCDEIVRLLKEEQFEYRSVSTVRHLSELFSISTPLYSILIP